MDKKRREKTRVKAVRRERRKKDIDVLMLEVTNEELKTVGFTKVLSDGSLFIRDWVALKSINQESKTHRLDIDVERCNGYIYCKNPIEYGYPCDIPWAERMPNERMLYLSTHTFYGNDYKRSTNMLRACGFNVTINNWDRPNVPL